MTGKRILVLGSGPVVFPTFQVLRLYTANAALEHLDHNEVLNCHKTSVIGQYQYKKVDVFQSITRHQPNRVVYRAGLCGLGRDFFSSEKIQIDNHYLNGINLHRKYWSLCQLLRAESLHMAKGQSVLRALKRILKLAKYARPIGLSTGAYALLLALHENPTSTIMVDGITFSASAYGIARRGQFSKAHAEADSYLLSCLPDEDRQRILFRDPATTRLLEPIVC